MVKYRDMLVYWYTGVLKCPLCVCMCVFKLPATIFIGMGPNLDTTSISKMSRNTFLEFLKFDPIFGQKTRFIRPKMGKIQDFYSDMPCHLSNQTTVPAHYFLSF